MGAQVGAQARHPTAPPSGTPHLMGQLILCTSSPSTPLLLMSACEGPKDS